MVDDKCLGSLLEGEGGELVCHSLAAGLASLGNRV